MIGMDVGASSAQVWRNARYADSGWYGFRTGIILVRLGGRDTADPEPEIRQQHTTRELTVGSAYRARGVG